MPTYDYRCTNCGHEFELFQSMSEGLKKKCPACAKLALERLIGTGAALIFKGSGFYETDYRSKDYKTAKDAETKSQSDSKADGKSETKADSGSENGSGKKTDTKSGSNSEGSGKAGGKSADPKPDRKPGAAASKPKPTSKD